jgi:hypothetical protein
MENKEPAPAETMECLFYSLGGGWGSGSTSVDRGAALKMVGVGDPDMSGYEINQRADDTFDVWLNGPLANELVIVRRWPDLIDLLRVLEPMRAHFAPRFVTAPSGWTDASGRQVAMFEVDTDGTVVASRVSPGGGYESEDVLSIGLRSCVRL